MNQKVLSLILLILVLSTSFTPLIQSVVAAKSGDEPAEMRLIPIAKISDTFKSGFWWYDYLFITSAGKMYASYVFDFDPESMVFAISSPWVFRYHGGSNPEYEIFNAEKNKVVFKYTFSREESIFRFYRLDPERDEAIFLSKVEGPNLGAIAVRVVGYQAGLTGMALCCNPLPWYVAFVDVREGGNFWDHCIRRDAYTIDAKYAILTSGSVLGGITYTHLILVDGVGNLYDLGEYDAIALLPEEGVLLFKNESRVNLLYYPSGFLGPSTQWVSPLEKKTPEGRILGIKAGAYEVKLIDFYSGDEWTVFSNRNRGYVYLSGNRPRFFGQLPYIAVLEIVEPFQRPPKYGDVYVISLWGFPGKVYVLDQPDAKSPGPGKRPPIVRGGYLIFSDNGKWAFNGTHVFYVWTTPLEDPQVGPRVRLNTWFDFKTSFAFNNSMPISLDLPPSTSGTSVTEYLIKEVRLKVDYLRTIPYTVDITPPEVKNGELWKMGQIDPGGTFWTTPKVCLPYTFLCGEPGEWPEPPKLEPYPHGAHITGRGIIKYTYLPIAVPLAFGAGYVVYGPGLSGGPHPPILLTQAGNLTVFGSFSPDFSYIDKSQQNVGFNWDTLWVLIPAGIGLTTYPLVTKRTMDQMRRIATISDEVGVDLNLIDETFQGWLEWYPTIKGKRVIIKPPTKVTVKEPLPAAPKVAGAVYSVKVKVTSAAQAEQALKDIQEAKRIIQKAKVDIESWWPKLLENDPVLKAYRKRIEELRNAAEWVERARREGVIDVAEAIDNLEDILGELRTDILPNYAKRVKELAEAQKSSFFEKALNALKKIDGAVIYSSIADMTIDVTIDRAIGMAATGGGVSLWGAGAGAAGAAFLAANGITSLVRWASPVTPFWRLYGTDYGYVMVFELNVKGKTKYLLLGYTSDNKYGNWHVKDIIREAIEDRLLGDKPGDLEPHPLIIDKIVTVKKLYTSEELMEVAKAGEPKVKALWEKIQANLKIQAKTLKSELESLYYTLDAQHLAELLKADPKDISIQRIVMYSVYVPWSVTSWFINVEIPVDVVEQTSGFELYLTIGNDEVIYDPDRQVQILNPTKITWRDINGVSRESSAEWVVTPDGATLTYAFMVGENEAGATSFTINSESKTPFIAFVHLNTSLWIKSHLVPLGGGFTFKMDIPCMLNITLRSESLELVDLPWIPDKLFLKIYGYDPDIGREEVKQVEVPGDIFVWTWRETGWYGYADADDLPILDILGSCFSMDGELVEGIEGLNTGVKVSFDSMTFPTKARFCVYSTRPDAYAVIKTRVWVEYYTREVNETIVHAERWKTFTARNLSETINIDGKQYFAKCFFEDIGDLLAEARELACQTGVHDVHLSAEVWLIESNYPGLEADDHDIADTLITCTKKYVEFCALVKDDVSLEGIAGAEVILYNKTQYQLIKTTNSTGHAYFGVIPAGEYNITATAFNYTEWNKMVPILRDYPCQNPYIIYLHRVETKLPVSVTITVYNGSSNQVLEGVEVSAYEKKAGKLVASGVTGTDGKVTLILDSSIYYRIVAEKDGFLPAITDFVTKRDTTLAISLTPMPETHLVTVTVLDANTSEPIEGAKVSFLDGIPYVNYTDSSGRAYFRLPEAVYTMKVEKLGYSSETRIVGVYRDLDLTVLLYPYPVPPPPIPPPPPPPDAEEGTVTIKVLEADTLNPVEGAVVVLWNQGETVVGTTNSSGMVTLNIKEWWYAYNITKPGYTPILNALRYWIVGETYVEYLTPEHLIKHATLHVRVLDEASNPIEGAYVIVQNSTTVLTDFTSLQGWANFTLNEGFYTVTASLQGYYPASVPIYVSGEFYLYLTLNPISPIPENFTVTVHVSDAMTGEPLDGALVQLSSGDFATSTTTSQGIAIFEEIPAGSYRLAVSKEPDYIPFYETITVDNNLTIFVSLIPKSIREIHLLQVQVLDANTSMPVQGALVKLKNSTLWFQSYTNETGWVSFLLPEDRYLMTIEANGYYTHSESLWLVSNMTITRMIAPVGYPDVVGKVVIKVIDSQSGSPIQGVKVEVTNETAPMFTNYTDSGGIVTFILEAGVYKIDFTHKDYAHKHVETFLIPERTYIFELVRSEELTATLTIKVSDAETLQPIPDAEVEIRNSTATVLLYTDEDGIASIILEKGMYEVKVTHPFYYDFGPIQYYIGADQVLNVTMIPRYECPAPPGSNWTYPSPCGLYWYVVQVVYKDGVGYPGANVKIYDASNSTQIANATTDGDGFAKFLLPANGTYHLILVAQNPETGEVWDFSEKFTLTASIWRVVTLPWYSPYFKPEVWAKDIEFWTYKPIWNETHLIFYEIWSNVEQNVTALIEVVDIGTNKTIASYTVSHELEVGSNVFWIKTFINGSGVAVLRPKLTIVAYENDTNPDNNICWGESLIFRPYLDISVLLVVRVLDFGPPGVMYPEHTIMGIDIMLESTAAVPDPGTLIMNLTYRSSLTLKQVVNASLTPFNVTRLQWINQTMKLPWAGSVSVSVDVRHPYEDMGIDNRKSQLIVIPTALKLLNATFPKILVPGQTFNVTMYVLANRAKNFSYQIMINNDTINSRMKETPEGISSTSISGRAPLLWIALANLTAYAGPDIWIGDNSLSTIVPIAHNWVWIMLIILALGVGVVAIYKASKHTLMAIRKRRVLRKVYGPNLFGEHQLPPPPNERPKRKRRVLRKLYCLTVVLVMLLLSTSITPSIAQVFKHPTYTEEHPSLAVIKLNEGLGLGQGFREPPYPELSSISVSKPVWNIQPPGSEFMLTGASNQTLGLMFDEETGELIYNSTQGLAGEIYSTWRATTFFFECGEETNATLSEFSFTIFRLNLAGDAVVELEVIQPVNVTIWEENVTIPSSATPSISFTLTPGARFKGGEARLNLNVYFTANSTSPQWLTIKDISLKVSHERYVSDRGIFIPLNVETSPADNTPKVFPQNVTYTFRLWIVPKLNLTWLSDEPGRNSTYSLAVYDSAGNLLSSNPSAEHLVLEKGVNYTIVIEGNTTVDFYDPDCGETVCSPNIGHFIELDAGIGELFNVSVLIAQSPVITASYPGILESSSANASLRLEVKLSNMTIPIAEVYADKGSAEYSYTLDKIILTGGDAINGVTLSFRTQLPWSPSFEVNGKSIAGLTVRPGDEVRLLNFSEPVSFGESRFELWDTEGEVMLRTLADWNDNHSFKVPEDLQPGSYILYGIWRSPDRWGYTVTTALMQVEAPAIPYAIIIVATAGIVAIIATLLLIIRMRKKWMMTLESRKRRTLENGFGEVRT